jgi:hypothetical protein
MDKQEKNSINKDITIIGGLDSIGVPYTPDNYDTKSFFDLIVEYLKEIGINVISANIFNPVRNRTFELQLLLKENHKVGTIKKKQIKYLAAYIKKTGVKYNPDIYKKYNVHDDNDEIGINELLRSSSNPIFLYSCGPLDIPYHIGTNNPVNPKKWINILKIKKVIQRVINGIEENIRYIQSINNNTEIYVLGTYNPSKVPIVEAYVNFYNEQIQIMCAQNKNVHYVNIKEVRGHIASNDTHPNREGQEIIAKQVIQSINENNQYLKQK